MDKAKQTQVWTNLQTAQMKQFLSEKAISFKGENFFPEALLMILLRLGSMRDAHILKQLPETEVWGVHL